MKKTYFENIMELLAESRQLVFSGHPVAESAEIFEYSDLPIFGRFGEVRDALLVFSFLLDQNGETDGVTVTCSIFRNMADYEKGIVLGEGSTGFWLENYTIHSLKSHMAFEKTQARHNAALVLDNRP